MELDGHVNFVTGADDYANSKPAPDGYLHAASMLGVDPAECLVFEDSIAGIRSARAAGMQVIAVTFRSNVSAGELQLADDAITNFDELEEGFFARIGRKS
jgi:sugar-phosphatase